MKNIKKLLLLILLIIFCSSCGNTSNLKSMSYKEFNEKLANKDTFFFVLVKDGCQYCEKFIPKVEEIVDEYNIIGYKLNYSSMSEDEQNEFYEKYEAGSTPTTMFIKDGKEISQMQRIEGNVSKEKVVAKLKSLNYIE